MIRRAVTLNTQQVPPGMLCIHYSEIDEESGAPYLANHAVALLSKGRLDGNLKRRARRAIRRCCDFESPMFGVVQESLQRLHAPRWLTVQIDIIGSQVSKYL